MHATLEKLRQDLSNGVSGLSNAETQAQRATGKWTIQQIVEHLTLSYAATYNVAAVRVAKGTPTLASPSLSQRLGQFAIATCGLFPPGRVAPPAVTPPETASHTLTGVELAGMIDSSLLQMDSALSAAEELFGPAQRCISHLILGPMSVTQWRRFHLAHGEHHLKQILATRRILAASIPG